MADIIFTADGKTAYQNDEYVHKFHTKFLAIQLMKHSSIGFKKKKKIVSSWLIPLVQLIVEVQWSCQKSISVYSIMIG